MNYLIANVLLVAGAVMLAFFLGHRAGVKRGRDEQWVTDYLASQRKTQAGRDKLGRFKKRKATYGKIKITAPKNEL
jgi:hypothetical protein